MHQCGSRGSQEASILTRPVTLDKHASGLQYLHLENGGLGYMVPETSPSPTPGVPSSQGRATEGLGGGGQPPSRIPAVARPWENCSFSSPQKAAGLGTPQPAPSPSHPTLSLRGGDMPAFQPCTSSSGAHPPWGERSLDSRSPRWERGCQGPPKVVQSGPWL